MLCPEQLSAMQLVSLCLASLGLLLVCRTRADSANPFEQLAAGALNVGGQLLNRLQDGNMVTPQMNFDTPLLAMYSKSQVGFGNAMRRQSDDSSSSESDERRKRRRRRRRRRRSVSRANHRLLHRKRRAPCFKMMNSDNTESSDDVEARKKRAKKRAAANNAARSRIVKKVMKKKKKLHEMQQLRARRRRQANDQEQGQQKLGPSVGDRVKGLWMSFVDNVFDMAQQMRERIKAAAAQASSSSN